MTEKQYKVISDNLGEYSVLTHDNIIVCTEIQDKTIAELFCDELNAQEEYINELENENEQLKKELTKFKEWEKYVGDVKREELDRVFKMSIYEIADAFKYYKERIKELENEMKE